MGFLGWIWTIVTFGIVAYVLFILIGDSLDRKRIRRMKRLDGLWRKV